MIAQLGMYDVPALQPANDAFWQAIRAELGTGPDHLDRTSDFWEVWQSPDLFFAQTCGYPFRAKLHDEVQLIGTPDYGLEGCPPGHYRSVFVTRRGAPSELAAQNGARFAYNEALSQSGWAAPVHHLLQAGITPGALVQTGGHALSARAVAEDRADFAGLDALTWTFLQRHEPDLTTQLQVVDQTAPTPTLPYITAQGRDAGQIANAVRAAITALPDETCNTLHLRGLVDIPATAYLDVPTPPPPSELLPDSA